MTHLCRSLRDPIDITRPTGEVGLVASCLPLEKASRVPAREAVLADAYVEFEAQWIVTLRRRTIKRLRIAATCSSYLLGDEGRYFGSCKAKIGFSSEDLAAASHNHSWNKSEWVPVLEAVRIN